MAKMLRAGWVPVKPEDLPTNYVSMTDKWNKFDNVVTAGADLILLKNTTDSVEQENELQEFKTRSQEEEVARAERFRSQTADSRYVKTKVTSNRSHVTYGQSDRDNDPDAADEAIEEDSDEFQE